MKFSVLLSVYYKENPDFLRQSLQSIFDQTIMVDEVILVKDGPLVAQLDLVIKDFVSKYNNLKVIEINNNVGLGEALNLGLSYCTYDLVARMDADDICFTNRFEKQLAVFEKYPDTDLVGSWTKEFRQDGNGELIELSDKKFPETSEEIYQYSKRRCPLEHPAVMFKKKSVLKAGGYQHFYLFEDYYLWIRMLVNGCKLYNIQEFLLYFRCSNDSFKRRGGRKYAMSEVSLINEFRKLGFLSWYDVIVNVCIRFPVRILPNQLRAWFYQTFLRK